MQIIIHRGTHQIGGVATEIRTVQTRLIIDMGDELSMDPGFQPRPLHISGVTDTNGACDAVLFTHNHGDHVGQIRNIRSDVPLYLGALAKEILLETLKKEDSQTIRKIQSARTFQPGKGFRVGDIYITPFSIDHSACDSYMFLIETDHKRILQTGDFRLHGWRGKAMPKILEKMVKKVDAIIIEGTTLSRDTTETQTEYELQKRLKDYIKKYKYVFVHCAATNLERICSFSKAVPRGKYFICDAYQARLLDILQKHWGKYSSLYRNIKKTIYGDNKLNDFRTRGFLMMVRDNRQFRKIIPQFDAQQSIMIYSMWEGYRTKPGSTIPDFLELVGRWETLHTSGHASLADICKVIEKCDPDLVIPIHTESPDTLKSSLPDKKVVLLQDGEGVTL